MEQRPHLQVCYDLIQLSLEHIRFPVLHFVNEPCFIFNIHILHGDATLGGGGVTQIWKF